MDRKTTVSVAIGLAQLERLTKVMERTRISRSVIVRDALERELQRYEQQLNSLGRVDGSSVVASGVAVVRKRTVRRP